MSAALTDGLAAPRAAGSLFATQATGDLSWGEFQARRAGLLDAVRRAARPRWAIACADPLEALLATLAVLEAGSAAVIPSVPRLAAADARALDCAVISDADPSATLRTAQAPGPADAPSPMLSPDATLEVMTSGSTGAPKRIAKQLAQIDAEIGALEAAFGAELGRVAVIGSVPHQHLYGLLFRLLWPLTTQRCIHLPQLMTPDQFDFALRRHPRAALVTSPALLTRFARWPEARFDVTAAFSSGSALPQSAARELGTRLSGPVYEVYGSTETGGVAWRRAGHEAMPWRPFDGVALSVEPDGEGRPRLGVRSGPTGDAWMDTGDAIELAADGGFTLLGRVDGVLKVEDKRVSAGQIEQQLLEHEWVEAAAVVRLERQRIELGAAVVLSPAGRGALEAQGPLALHRALAAHLARWFDPVVIPRRWRWPTALPRSGAGKVALPEVAALFAAAEGPDAPA